MQILLIDDRSWIREILRGHIARQWPQADVQELDSQALVSDGGVRDVRRFDVIVLARTLAQVDSLETLRAIRTQSPASSVIVMMDASDQASIVNAFRAGAADILPVARLDEQVVQTVIREALRGPSPTPRSATATPRVPPLPDVSLRDYEIECRIASSALSSVYLARSPALGQSVAVKVLRGLGGQGGESLERFVREYTVLSAIRHDHIVEIYDIGSARDDIYITMEYLPGGTLREALRSGTLDESRCVALTEQICGALGSIHAAGILHRDLKPANIMLRADGSACLIDFGLAKRLFVEQELTVPGRIYGTPYYMSPEQGQGQRTGPRSDIYSLGILFYELLTGTKPYVASTPVALVFKHAHAPLPVLPQRLARWQSLLDRLLAKEPDDRPATATEVGELLNLCKNR